MIPYHTDAPLYHLPVATVGLMLLNIALFFSVPNEFFGDRTKLDGWEKEVAELAKPRWNDADFAAPNRDAALKERMAQERQRPNISLRLQFGNGLQPLQWVTSPFLHDGLGQLLFNMLALWAFGLVVEGKVGWWKFLLLYVAIGVVQAAVVQTLFAFSDSAGVVGGNAVMLGLLGIAIAWAPKNNFDVWFGYYIGSHEVSILIYGFVQLTLGLIAFTFLESLLDGGMLQILGLPMGIGLGLFFLNRKWVDCEGWDIVTVLKGQQAKVDENAELESEARRLVSSTQQASRRRHANKGQLNNQRSQSSHASDQASPNKDPEQSSSPNTNRQTSSHQDLEQLISAGNYETALKLLSRLRQSGNALELPQPLLGKLVRDLLAAQQFKQAVPVMVEHIERFPVKRVAVQLNLAKVLLHLERPQRALLVLRETHIDESDEASRAAWQNLAAHAKQQIKDGVIELSE